MWLVEEVTPMLLRVQRASEHTIHGAWPELAATTYLARSLS
jgi:hypothetical protein